MLQKTMVHFIYNHNKKFKTALRNLKSKYGDLVQDAEKGLRFKLEFFLAKHSKRIYKFLLKMSEKLK
jgi:hypothetical protein